MSSKNVVVTIELGHTASVRQQKTATGFTHDWEVFVRGIDGASIESFVAKVVFYLHSSFPKPCRVVKKPPFNVSELGYGGFILPIEVYFKTNDEPQKTSFKYDLYLQSLDSAAISKTRREKLTFLSPSEEFRRKLVQGGGTEVSSGEDSKINEKSVSRPSSGAKTKPVVRHQANAVPTAPHSGGSIKKKSKVVPPKKDVPKLKPKPDSFQALFGEIIKTGSDQKCVKEKSSKEREKSSSKSHVSKKEKEHFKESSKEKESKKDHKTSSEREREKSKEKKKSDKKVKEPEKVVSKDRNSDKERKKESSKRPRTPPLSEEAYKKKKEEEKKRKRSDELVDKKIKKDDLEEKRPKTLKISNENNVPLLPLPSKTVEKPKPKEPSRSKTKPSKVPSSPTPPPLPLPLKEEKVASIREKSSSKRGRPPKEHKPKSPPPPVKAKEFPPRKSRSRSKSSSRSLSPSLSLSNSTNQSSSHSSRSSSRQSLSRSRSRSSSSRSSSSSAKSKSRSRSVSRSSSRSKSPVRSPSSSSCDSSPSRETQRVAPLEEDVVVEKPLKILFDEALQGNSETSSEEDDKPLPPPKKISKGKVTPSLKASPLSIPRGPPVHQPNMQHSSSDDDSDSDLESEKPVQVRRTVSPYVNSPKVPNGRDHEEIAQLPTPPSVKNDSPKINFNDDYLGDLLDLRQKILLSFSNRCKVQEIVNIIGNNDKYELCEGHFTFDLCALDRQTIKKLQDYLS